MSGKSTIEKYSLREIRKLAEREGAATRPDAPEAESLGEAFWSRARVVVPPGKASVHLRVDRDVLEWFKQQGAGHLTRMNAVLRSYMEAQKARN